MIQLIDFYADWCGPCKVMEPIFKELEKDYQGKVEFRRVDVDVENAFSSQYGVMSIPTFVILKDGKEASRKIGAMPKEIIKNWINSNL
ncbi:thioredoxin [candidate division WWE3 bacterium RIFCSPHIGHO2_12_FULL_38_15]|uniref:Thioredoxin n=1 Tax=candidate division WWE3 bacterium RIFCSPHIGHO2_02_FULL_38_14 TaxID=1802620 RepID=A0A1F4V6M6_UNCKA|nr:MAG: thioredoxin [candidate division WWE3 bacterium RIFCSPHIGHO2_01_FULL_38_45]OGC49236.1 MAG: thioredoxin [candidate division WWE3 bacterium RIFCSPHIGHO2_12_FULL_38_15]OGC52845.1 MAG: thioredoxin [candidate division WWE3 bacterium RIFCSPHIGHO2_02_FULL_38_14]OGC54131.1 MAG: thioredoxin [candidate division WWE3 bacterium RIFCSPLOWO2_01_FULL_37_24]HLB51326.1 thioredoxin [Patescibacteria group bacterium]